MQGREASVTVNQARAVLVSALGLADAPGWEVVVTAETVTPDPGEPAAGQARELLRRAFNVPAGRDFLVIVRPATATFVPAD